MKRLLLPLLFVAVLLAATPCYAQGMSPEGTWLIRVLFEGEFEKQYLQVFTQDGKTTAYLPTAGPVNQGDPRIACTGEWRRARGSSYDVTLYCLHTQEWEAYPARHRLKLTLDKGAETFTECPFTYEWFFPDGSPAGAGFGVQSGTRLPIVPFE